MKTIAKTSIQLLIILALFITSCKKDKAVTNSNTSSIKTTISNLRVLLNEEGRRIVDDAMDYDYSVGVIDNPNYGKFGLDPAYDVYLGGATPNDIKISLNGTEYAAQSNGQWAKNGIEFKNYFGTKVKINISDSKNSQAYEVYVPTHALAKKLGMPQSQYINRTGNVLTWTPDPLNKTGKVALYYHLCTGDNGDTWFANNVLLLDDNGSFSLDDVLSDTKTTKINFMLITGNVVSFITKDNKKLICFIRSCDSHEYFIQ